MISKFTIFLLSVIGLFITSSYLIVTSSIQLSKQVEDQEPVDVFTLITVILGGITFLLAVACSVLAAQYPLNYTTVSKKFSLSSEVSPETVMLKKPLTGWNV